MIAKYKPARHFRVKIGGNLLLEKFYSTPGEDLPDAFARSKWKEALHDDVRVTMKGREPAEEQVYVGRLRSHNVVWACHGELLVQVVGCGVYDHLALEEVLKTLIAVIKLLSKQKTVSEATFLANFGKISLGLDEVVHLGQVETLDKDQVYKAIKLKSATK